MTKIPHSRPSLGREEKAACSKVIDSLYLAGGPRVEAFEAAFAKSVGRRYGIAVSSGTAALTMSLRALALKPGRIVAMPSYTCAALLHALDFAGLKPLITDIDADDMNMSASDFKKRIKKNTAAVIVPHLFGRAADMRAFKKIGLPIIEDGTQALGGRAFGQPVGSFGEMSIFSFYATKMMTTGEGGMIVTDSAKLAAALRDMCDYDKKKDYRFRMNFKMSDLQAAIGIEQLKKLPGFVRSRQKLAAIYNTGLSSSRMRGSDSRLSAQKIGETCSTDFAVGERGNDKPFAHGSRFFPPPCYGGGQVGAQPTHVYFRYVLRAQGGSKTLIRRLNAKGIEAKSPVFKPLHRYVGLPDSAYPETVRAMREACSLPIFPAMTAADVRNVINAVLTFKF